MIEHICDGNKIENKTKPPYVILVAEDDHSLLNLIQKILRREGFETKGVANGADAIAFALNSEKCVMLLDYTLPDMQGNHVIQTLAEQPYRVPFIIMTGHSDVKIAVEMMKLGARDYLVKDSEFLDMLPSVVNRVVDQLEMEERLTKAENEIKEARDFLENVFKTSADGIIATDPDGFITMVNEALEKMLGYSKGELIGKSALEFSPQEKNYREEGKKMMEKLMEEATITGMERAWIGKDGDLVNIEVNSALLKDKEGNVKGAVSSIRDITERKEIERKLLQSEKLKSLGELSGGVAHDFNNVLAAILGRVQLLKMQFKPPSGKQEKRKSMLDLVKSLDIIERASLDGAETVRRIQEFSRKRVDDKEFTKIDMNELIDNALEFTSVRWKNDAESKGITITIQKEFSTLPPTSGSASELREVFTNLINNAIDAMPKGGRIKIKTFRENGHISIAIQDTGVGISEAIRNRIFDPFFTTKGVQSTGLGMSVSYGIINRHGGTIRVDSTEGKGSTFAITIPISDNILLKEEKTKPVAEEKRKSTILVIEDEEEVRNLLADILIENGHQVETASDGNQGIDMFKKKDFDLVFTDLGMPGTSGWEVAEKIKAINDSVPIALITGWNVELSINMSEMKNDRVDFVVQKPFEINQILKLVQEGMVLRDQFKAA